MKTMMLCLIVLLVASGCRPVVEPAANSKSSANDVASLPSAEELLKYAFPGIARNDWDVYTQTLLDPESKKEMKFGLTPLDRIALGEWAVLVASRAELSENGFPSKVGGLSVIWLKRQDGHWKKVYHELSFASSDGTPGSTALTVNPELEVIEYGNEHAILCLKGGFVQWAYGDHHLKIFDLIPNATLRLSDEILTASFCGGIGREDSACLEVEGEVSFHAATDVGAAAAYPKLRIVFKGSEYRFTGNYDEDKGLCGAGWKASRSLVGQVTYAFQDGRYQPLEGANLAEEMDHYCEMKHKKSESTTTPANNSETVGEEEATTQNHEGPSQAGEQ